LKATLSGEITSFEVLGEVLRYEGTVLCPGTWQGIDGNKITYSAPVVSQGAGTFSGVSLHDGNHQDLTREAVKGFNAVSWSQDGCIRNRGYIWHQPTIEKIMAGEYPMGQSMEADVWVDENMNAVKIQGSSIAIGISNPACRSAKIESLASVRLSMDETKKKALLESATVIGEPSGKAVLLAEEDYVQMKALAEKGKTVDSMKTDLEALKASLGKMVSNSEAKEITEIAKEISVMDSAFKVEAYCEGIADHAMKMRMLNAYKTTLSKFTPVLPATSTPVEVKNEDLAGASKEVFGVEMKEMLLGGNK
jgi:hypothetical protein